MLPSSRGDDRRRRRDRGAGPASSQQVGKFTKAIQQEMKKRGVDGMKLGVDFIDINMIKIFQDELPKLA